MINGKGSIETLSTQVGGSSSWILYGAFECAFHMFACIAQVLNYKIHACVMYASCKIEWWNGIIKLLSFSSKFSQVISFQSMFPSGLELTMVLRMV